MVVNKIFDGATICRSFEGSEAPQCQRGSEHISEYPCEAGREHEVRSGDGGGHTRGRSRSTHTCITISGHMNDLTKLVCIYLCMNAIVLNLAKSIESKSICHSKTLFISAWLPCLEYFQDRIRTAAFQRYDPNAITARCTDSIVAKMRGSGD